MRIDEICSHRIVRIRATATLAATELRLQRTAVSCAAQPDSPNHLSTASRSAAMFTNVGTADRAVRILIGLAMILLAFFGEVPAWVGWVGLIPLATALIRMCPLYWVLGIGRD
jgi:hypothetical protein